MREPLRYVGRVRTQNNCAGVPAGTWCEAYRDYYDHLVLKLRDGQTLEFECFYFASGLENRD
jgi:hypothetical protein